MTKTEKRIEALNRSVACDELIKENDDKMIKILKSMIQDLYDKIEDISIVANRLAENKLFPKEFLTDSRDYGEFGFDDTDIKNETTFSGLWMDSDSNTRFNLWNNCGDGEKVELGKIDIDTGKELPIDKLDYLDVLNAYYNFEKEFYDWFDKKYPSEVDYKEQKSEMYERIEGIQSEIDDIEIEFNDSIPDLLGNEPTYVTDMVQTICVLNTEISDWLDKHKDWR